MNSLSDKEGEGRIDRLVRDFVESRRQIFLGMIHSPATLPHHNRQILYSLAYDSLVQALTAT
jgi:hypothetical protein